MLPEALRVDSIDDAARTYYGADLMANAVLYRCLATQGAAAMPLIGALMFKDVFFYGMSGVQPGSVAIITALCVL